MEPLPLVEFAKSLFADLSLQNIRIISAQHLLGTTHTMFHSLFELGLKPKNVSVIGKCYSSSPVVAKRMQDEGIFVSPFSFSFDGHKAFDNQYRVKVKLYLRDILRHTRFSDFEKVIFLDDGGYLLAAAQDLLVDTKNVIGIEQTTSGYEKLKGKELRFPIINVARSPAKLICESPLIAEVIAKKICYKMRQFDFNPHTVLIIGKGVIGTAIYNSLKDQFHVEMVDMEIKSEPKAMVSFEKNLKKFDVIIGCTGQCSFHPRQHKLLKKGAVLVSASSSDREFQAVSCRKQLPRTSDCHADIEIGHLRLLNGGFPLNFDGKIHSVPPHSIQLTRALLTAAILQAYDLSNDAVEDSSRFINLDPEVQRDLVREFQRIHPGPKSAPKPPKQLVLNLTPLKVKKC